MRSRCGLQLETCRPRHHYGTQGLTASQPRPADIFTAALGVCVASSNAAAARGHAAQAAFDRKLSHYRDEISELRNQGIHCRPFI